MGQPTRRATELGHDQIAFHASGGPAEPIARAEYRLRIGGRLALHGVTRPESVEAVLKVFMDAVQLRGGCSLLLSDYRIKPVTALGGAIKLKDELHLEFDLVAFLERS